MTGPSALIQSRYEVIRLKDGSEVVGMTKDLGEYLEITLPMICQLSLVPGTPRTNAVFYPYSPLSSDERVKLPKTIIVHRNLMNEQFIPFYDNASSRWFEMIENGSIPLSTTEDIQTQEVMRRSLNQMMTKLGKAPSEEFIEQTLEDLELERDMEDWEDDDFIFDKTKLH
jgi:hypothetical protein|tara:strand:- start:456 stop:965 length:510 start_codon:yes stop_codon:yes gene_type:complete